MEQPTPAAKTKENKENKHFVEVSEEDRQKILQNRVAQNTRRATKLWVTRFQEFIAKKHKNGKFAESSLVEVCDADLPKKLEIFYTELRDKNGELYKNTTMKAMRAAINRFIKETRGIDVVNDDRFVICNEMFRGVTKMNKEEGKGK